MSSEITLHSIYPDDSPAKAVCIIIILVNVLNKEGGPLEVQEMFECCVFNRVSFLIVVDVRWCVVITVNRSTSLAGVDQFYVVNSF